MNIFLVFKQRNYELWTSCSVVEFWLCGLWFDLQWERSRYILLMRPNKVETIVKWFRILYAVLVGFSGHGNSVYNI